MSTYYLDLKSHSRKDRANAIALASYRSGEKLRCDADGLIRNCRRQGKSHVEYTALFNNRNLSRERLWNLAEYMERRKDSVVAREMKLALPCELNLEKRKDLCIKISDLLAKRYNCAVDLALHEPDFDGDDRNYHAHILFTARSWDESKGDTFESKKYRQLNKATASSEVIYWRETWEELVNKAYLDAGVDESVSSKTCEAQGKERLYDYADFKKYNALRREGKLGAYKRKFEIARQLRDLNKEIDEGKAELKSLEKEYKSFLKVERKQEKRRNAGFEIQKLYKPDSTKKIYKAFIPTGKLVTETYQKHMVMAQNVSDDYWFVRGRYRGIFIFSKRKKAEEFLEQCYQSRNEDWNEAIVTVNGTDILAKHLEEPIEDEEKPQGKFNKGIEKIKGFIGGIYQKIKNVFSWKKVKPEDEELPLRSEDNRVSELGKIQYDGENYFGVLSSRRHYEFEDLCDISDSIDTIPIYESLNLEKAVWFFDDQQSSRKFYDICSSNYEQYLKSYHEKQFQKAHPHFMKITEVAESENSSRFYLEIERGDLWRYQIVRAAKYIDSELRRGKEDDLYFTLKFSTQSRAERFLRVVNEGKVKMYEKLYTDQENRRREKRKAQKREKNTLMQKPSNETFEEFIERMKTNERTSDPIKNEQKSAKDKADEEYNQILNMMKERNKNAEARRQERKQINEQKQVEENQMEKTLKSEYDKKPEKNPFSLSPGNNENTDDKKEPEAKIETEKPQKPEDIWKNKWTAAEVAEIEEQITKMKEMGKGKIPDEVIDLMIKSLKENGIQRVDSSHRKEIDIVQTKRDDDNEQSRGGFKM